MDRYVDGDVLYVTCIGADVNEEDDVRESRESERDMATDTSAGVIFDTGDAKYIASFVWGTKVMCQ